MLGKIKKCPFCNREIEPEITRYLEPWGIIIRKHCPKCSIFLGQELKSFNRRKKGLRSIKEILLDRPPWYAKIK